MTLAKTKVGVVRPHGLPTLESVDITSTDANGHTELNRLVGGWLETFDVLCSGTRASMYVNEEGILLNLPPNRAVYATKEMADAGYASQADYRSVVREGDLYTVLFGNVVIVNHDEIGRPCDLDEETLKTVAAQFFEPSSIGSGERELAKMRARRHRERRIP